MKKKELKHIETHKCCIKLPEGISIERYEMSGNAVWFHQNDNTLNAILYCPFCGENLKQF